jgi:hypothetical protein
MTQNLLRQLRYYSTSRATKLWVKYYDFQPTQVSVKGCEYLDDFCDNVSKRYNLKCLVNLYTCLEQEPLDPGILMKEFQKTYPRNTSKTPLFVEATPLIENPIVKKTIYVGDVDEDGYFTGKYRKMILGSSDDLAWVFRRSHGLIHLSEPDTLLVSFEYIKNGETYYYSIPGRSLPEHLMNHIPVKNATS